MIYPNRLSDFFKQDCLAHSWWRDDQAALSSPERRQQIDRPSADGVRLWIFKHDPALRKLRRKFVEVRRLAPLLGRLAFDCCDLFKHEEFLAVARKPYNPGELLTRPQVILLYQRAWNAHILGDRQEVQFWPAEYCERITHLVDKSLRGDTCPSGQSGADYIQNVLMTRARRMQMQMQIAGQDFQLFTGKSLHLV